MLSPWTREHLLHQGVDVGPAKVFQDNKSTICLAVKGKSTSERTRHVKVRHFFITHYIDEGAIVIEHLPTGDMIADIMTKPLHGSLFDKFARQCLGLDCATVEDLAQDVSD